ncbi:leucine-rich repeat domain-containing protein [Persicirhabdus sediminis]|uniref:Leucine-rich repeat domain-containing protein n=1 Tax=Persicirhabdus sediminis TaxID=454144 RepID=A0A8J7MJM5_9BACT|nr:leucine-rich repeat domain-containing protein [Persicirhabdus sediminis]MBK1792223.1 leucine-rich repeat domain-containing protein [Persicirhabdus sediminis]
MEDLSYTSTGDSITITGCSTSAAGELVIPDTIDGLPVTEIAEKAFYWCNSLTSINIPDTVTSIGYSAFYNCSSLVQMEFLGNAPSVTVWLFGYSYYKDLIIKYKAEYYEAFQQVPWNLYQSEIYHPDLTYSLNSDGSSAILTYCSNSATGFIPISPLYQGVPVTVIGENAFIGCSSIANISIPESVTSIEDGAFSGCSSIESVTFLGDAPSVMSDPFGSTTNENLIIKYKAEYYEVFQQVPWNVYPAEIIHHPDLTYTLSSDGNSAILTACSSSVSGSIHISPFYQGVPVTAIGDNAFLDCSSLTSINIPESVSSVGDSAFKNCKVLTFIKLPDTVTSIGGFAFWGCRALASVNIPDTVTSIEDCTFVLCQSLTSITIPDSITFIGKDAFGGCTALTSINIPDSVTFIESRAFYGCMSLTNISLPNSITSIENSTFADCLALININIPGSVTSIESYAFEDCTSLASINIPRSVSYMNTAVFRNCSSLTSVYFLGNAPEAGMVIFSDCEQVTSYILADSTGFTTPNWQFRPVVVIGTEELLADSWLQLHGRAPHVDLSLDDTGDGVSLLMARALNLRPDENLAGKMPKPQIYDGSLGLMFHGQSKGVDYLVESSSDLVNWSSQNVNLSEPDADGMRVAEASTEGEEKLFIRLTVNASELD